MNSINKEIYLKLSIIFIVLCSIIYSKDALTVKEIRPGSLIIELSVDSLWFSPDKKQIFTSPTLDLYQKINNPRLPYYKEVLIGIPANADIKIYRSKKNKIGYYKPLVQKEDKLKLEMSEPLPDVEFNGLFPAKIVELIPTVDIYGTASSLIKIFPIEVNAGALSLVKNITVQLSWDTSLGTEIPVLLSKSSFNLSSF